jgi:hypothetical protein
LKLIKANNNKKGRTTMLQILRGGAAFENKKGRTTMPQDFMRTCVGWGGMA